MHVIKSSKVRAILIVVFIALASQLAQGSDWLIENVDLSGEVGWTMDIECKDPNQVRMLYDMPSSEYDYYAIRDASGWSYYYSFANYSAFDLTLDSAGRSRMLTTEYNGSFHVLDYWQETSSGAWYRANVASEVNLGNAKLGIDQQNNAHLAFIDQTTLTLKCATIQGDLNGYWNIQVDTVTYDPLFNAVNEHIQLAMDNVGKPNILWYDYGTSRLKRAFQPTPGGAWQVDTIYTGNMPRGFSAAFDSDNNLHLAYSDYITGTSRGQIRHAVYDGTQWSDENVSISGDQVGSLVIDSNDRLHIGYVDFDTAANKDVFRYATDMGTYWHDEVVYELYSSVQGNEELDMVMDSEGHLHMAFRGDANELRYARLDTPPQPGPTEEVAVTVSLDCQANRLPGGGFAVIEGTRDIDLRNGSSSDEHRGILEFFIDELDVDAEIVSARLEFQIWMFGNSGGPTGDSWPTPLVYVFEGDGIIDTADAEKTTTLIGLSEEVQELGIHSIDLDPEILSAQLAENPWLGLLIILPEEMINFLSLESPGGISPTLILGIAIPPVYLPGDANKDGEVNNADAIILAEHWLMSSGATWEDGDFNDDGKVNNIDVTLMASNWQRTATGASVPEPGSFALLLAGAMMLFVRRRPGIPFSPVACDRCITSGF